LNNAGFKMMNLKFNTFLIIISLGLCGCSSIDPTAPGPQPHTLENTGHQPRLNVFGILRPDLLQGLPLSYVHLEFAYPTDDIPDSSIISDASVKIVKLNGATAIDSSLFIYSDLEVFPTREYRNGNFSPQAGTYHLICARNGYPTLTAQTTIPPVAVIQAGSLQKNGNELSFNIERAEQIRLYEVVLIGTDWSLRDRCIRPKTGDISVVFSLKDIAEHSGILIIYGYDLNLSEYLTANLSIKPNIYQKDFSTVENGYGCFGALNVYRQVIHF
jgi:hypothetical protein